MTDARKAARETKHEYRRLVSLEHAKTRGIATMAFQNTIKLRTYLHRTWIVGGLGWVGLVGLLGYLWWGQ